MKEYEPQDGLKQDSSPSLTPIPTAHLLNSPTLFSTTQFSRTGTPMSPVLFGVGSSPQSQAMPQEQILVVSEVDLPTLNLPRINGQECGMLSSDSIGAIASNSQFCIINRPTSFSMDEKASKSESLTPPDTSSSKSDRSESFKHRIPYLFALHVFPSQIEISPSPTPSASSSEEKHENSCCCG